jgi:arylsulfatase A-like enzyme
MRAIVLILVLGLMVWILYLKEPPGPSVGQGGGVYTRLVLRHATPQPEPETSVLRKLVPERDLDGWEGQAAERVSYNTTKPVQANYDPEAPLGPQRIPAILLKGDGPKHLRLPGDYDPRKFSQVMVLMSNHGKTAESVRVVLEVKGRVAVSSPWLAVPTSRGFAQRVVYDLPHARRAGRSFDALRIDFKGNGGDTITVNEVALWHRPPAAFLPRPGGLGRLVTIAREEHRGIGLSSRAPLEATFEVPPDGELNLTFGLTEHLRVYGEQPRLTLTLEAAGQEPITRTHALESSRNEPALWHSERIDLSAWAGLEARARFELAVEGDHEGLAVIAEAAVSRRGEQVPTVTLITSDTHRADHLSSTGDRVSTPVLDALAERGVLYENSFAPTNVTNPSHVSLMTATSPRDTHILNNNTPLIGDAVTLAECFADAGYRTYAAISAYHLLDVESGLGQGFDRVNGPKAGERDGAKTLDILDEWLRDAAGQPLFVWLHLFDAHAPYAPVERYKNRYWEGGDPFAQDTPVDMPEIEVPGFLRGLRDKDYPYAMYRGEVDYVDELMGRLLGHARIADGVLAFTSDHGEAFGEHGIWWDHADLYPETVQVPLILVWPGGRTGVRSDAPVEMIDIGRTLLDLSGLEDASFPGRSLMWALDDRSATQARFTLSAHGFVASVASSGWQLHLHLRKHKEWAIEEWRETHQVELYDLNEDPGSMNDLAKDPASFERARKLRQRLIDWLNSADTQGLGTSKVLTEDALASLEAMGYSGGDSHAPAFVSDPETNSWDAYFEGR